MDFRGGFPLYGTGPTRAGDLDVETIGDSCEIGGGALLIGSAGLPCLAGALCANTHLTVDRVAHGRRDRRGDLPFAGLKMKA